MTACTHDASQYGLDWQRLRDELTAWLQYRFRSIDAANVAGDAVLLAMTRFGCESIVAPARVWSWLRRTAVNRVYYDHRRAKRYPITILGEMDVPANADGGDRSGGLRLVDEMLRATRGIEHQVLIMLLESSRTNEQMAACIGANKRTIERARMRLRQRFQESLRNRRDDAGPEHL